MQDSYRFTAAILVATVLVSTAPAQTTLTEPGFTDSHVSDITSPSAIRCGGLTVDQNDNIYLVGGNNWLTYMTSVQSRPPGGVFSDPRDAASDQYWARWREPKTTASCVRSAERTPSAKRLRPRSVQ